MADWYYARGGERFGPMSIDDLKRAAADGEVRATDRAWTDGWAEWQPATDVPGIHFADGAELNYAGNGELPPRAANVLRRYARPTGDTGTWPLGEAHLDALADAGRNRRRVHGGRGTLRNLVILHLVLGVFFVVALKVDAQSQNGVIVITGGIFAAAAALYFLAGRAVRRNYRWGAGFGIALLLLNIAACGFLLTYSLRTNIEDREEAIVVFGLGIVLFLVCLVFVARAFGAIKRFRASPAWCQEAILRSEHRRRRD